MIRRERKTMLIAVSLVIALLCGCNSSGTLEKAANTPALAEVTAVVSESEQTAFPQLQNLSTSITEHSIFVPDEHMSGVRETKLVSERDYIEDIYAQYMAIGEKYKADLKEPNQTEKMILSDWGSPKGYADSVVNAYWNCLYSWIDLEKKVLCFYDPEYTGYETSTYGVYWVLGTGIGHDKVAELRKLREEFDFLGEVTTNIETKLFAAYSEFAVAEMNYMGNENCGYFGVLTSPYTLKTLINEPNHYSFVLTRITNKMDAFEYQLVPTTYETVVYESEDTETDILNTVTQLMSDLQADGWESAMQSANGITGVTGSIGLLSSIKDNVARVDLICSIKEGTYNHCSIIREVYNDDMRDMPTILKMLRESINADFYVVKP